jgi:endonuclease/exonuclease/phosphatase family metal-dependent hydrolase
MAHGIEVLSLNLWSVPILSPFFPARLHAFLSHVEVSPTLTVLCLQECWTFGGPLSARLAAAGFPFIVHHPSGAKLPFGARGSGLVIASRKPIVFSCFHAFSARGSPLRALNEMDGWAGKGIQLARVRLDGGDTVEVYNTHLCASYGAADAYGGARASQAIEGANFIAATRRSPMVVLCGDLNDVPGALPPRLLMGLCGLIDAHGDGSPTCNVHTSVFKKAGAAPAKLDYVLFSGAEPSRPGAVLFSQPTVPVAGPRALVNVSDHCALHASFHVAARAAQKPGGPPHARAPAALLEEAHAALAGGVARCRASARARLCEAALCTALSVAAAAAALRGAGGGGGAAAAALAVALLLAAAVLVAGAVEDFCFEATALEAALCAVGGLQREAAAAAAAAAGLRDADTPRF